MKKNTKHLPKNNQAPLGIKLLHAGLCGALLGIILLLAAAVALSFAVPVCDAPSTLILPAAVFCMFVCGYGGAWLGAKKARAKECNPYHGGLTAFGILGLLISAVSLFVPNAPSQTLWGHLLPIGVLLLSSTLGSLTAALHRPGQKRKLKKLLRR